MHTNPCPIQGPQGTCEFKKVEFGQAHSCFQLYVFLLMTHIVCKRFATRSAGWAGRQRMTRQAGSAFNKEDLHACAFGMYKCMHSITCAYV